MKHEEQLSWEARVGRVVAFAALASAVLLVASLIYSSSTLKQETHDTIDGLRLLHEHKGEVLVTTILQSLSTALLAAPLWFLFEVTRYRRKELPTIARYLALLAPPVAGILAIIRQIQVANISDKVIAHLSANPRPPAHGVGQAAAGLLVDNQYAKDQLSHGAAQVVGGLALAAGLGLAFAFVIISLNAMRAGVLSRFMGIVGIIVGVLFVIPLLGSVPIVEVFWVAALAALFLGKWPQGGRGPAWDSGEAIPWPSAQERAAEMAAARADREVGDEDDLEPEPEPVATGARDDGGSHPVAREHTHPRSKKRKRKRR